MSNPSITKLIEVSKELLAEIELVPGGYDYRPYYQLRPRSQLNDPCAAVIRFRQALEAVKAPLPVSPAPAGEWQDIASLPTEPMAVEFYYGKVEFRDQHGNLSPLPAYRDAVERREYGYWDGKTFCYSGTGHALDEFGDTEPEYLPTHWRPISASPSPPASTQTAE